MLILHIGLPKTGSTFLQYQVFNRQARYVYIDNIQIGSVHKALRRYVRASSADAEGLKKQTLELIPKGDVLISDETITMDSREAWTGNGANPEQTASRLAALGREENNVRIILGVRRQDTWLASRYAESAHVFPGFSQADFEDRVIEICTGGPHGVLRWLNYHEALKVLVQAVGEDNVLLLPQELLAHYPLHALRGLEHFLSVQGLVRSYKAGQIDLSKRNVLAAGSGQWQLRGHNGELLRLSDIASAMIRARFAGDNRRIPEQRWLRLREYGYY